MADAFSLAGYRSLLEALLARGYSVRGYADAEPERRHLILRHDLDVSLDAALPIAEIEHEIGLASHYFVLLRTEMYNPFSAAAARVVSRLRDLGHHIGLHLDGSLYGDDPVAIAQAAEFECDLLERIAGAPVQVISFHRPAAVLIGKEGPLARRRHTYEPRYVSHMGYCSDSRGAWHHGHPLDHAAVQAGRALQLLTHPVWWVFDEFADPVGKLDDFLVERTDLLKREVAANCEPYRVALQRRS